MSALKNNHDIMSLKSDGCVYYLDIKYELDTETKYSYDPYTRLYKVDKFGNYLLERGRYIYDSRTKYKKVNSTTYV